MENPLATDASELVMVVPTDSVESVAAKVRASRVLAVQLLVAEGNSALQAAESVARLRALTDRDGTQLTIISSDERVLEAARANQIETVGVNGTRVVPGSPRRPRAATTLSIETQPIPYATQQFDRQALAGATNSDDDDFLDDLQRLPTDFASYEHLDDALDDDFETDTPAPRRQAVLRRDEDDLDDEQDIYIPPRSRARVAAAPIPARGAARALQHGRVDTNPRRLAAGAARSLDHDDALPQRRGSVILPVVVGALLVLALGGYWLYSNRPIVQIWPPASAVKETPFINEVIPVGESSADKTAIVAAPLSSTAEVTVQGRASQQMSPAGTARGKVQIINTLGNGIDLPAGTQFIATGADGKQVGFLIDSPASVPPSITTNSSLGSSTQFGNLEVQVSAQSAGSASNVGENTISQMIVPGQPAIPNNQTVRMLNGPIEGGSEEPKSIVSEQDVRSILGAGLTQLYQQGVTTLQAKQAAAGYTLDPTTVFPSPKALGDPVSYEQPVITPPIGQPVDAANPVFTLVLRATFSGLATPADRPISTQIQTFMPQYLNQQKNGKLCAPSDSVGFPVTAYSWNGQQLAVDGAITCTPHGALSAETLAQAKNALVGQPLESAKAGLEQLQRAGVIGGYALPQVESFSRFGFLLRVEQAPGGAPAPATPEGIAAPTTGGEIAPTSDSAPTDAITTTNELAPSAAPVPTAGAAQ